MEELDMLLEEEQETVQDMTFDTDKFTEAVIWGTDWTTETINNQLIKGNIDLNPSFQRRDAWTDAEKSKLIESLMLGLPVPPIILAENKNRKNSYIVIDGKQRLLSIRRFFSEDKNAEFKPLKLKSLDILSFLNGSAISSIRENFPEYLRNLENQPIRTIVIKNWPDEPFLYTVFLRLNTGSKKLSSQELRQALKPGKFLDYLDEVTAESQPIMKVLNNKKADTRMKDIELSLRFFAYYYYLEDYTGNLKDFLDKTCERLNKDWSIKENEIKKTFSLFEQTIKFSYEIMDNQSPFSRYEKGKSNNRFNMSVFELFMYFFSNQYVKKLVKENRDEFLKLFVEMNDSMEFQSTINGTTHDVHHVFERFNCFYSILCKLSNDSANLIPKICLNNGKLIVQNNTSD